MSKDVINDCHSKNIFMNSIKSCVTYPATKAYLFEFCLEQSGTVLIRQAKSIFLTGVLNNVQICCPVPNNMQHILAINMEVLMN